MNLNNNYNPYRFKKLEIFPEDELYKLNINNVNMYMYYYQIPFDYIMRYYGTIDFTIFSKFQKISEEVANEIYFKINWELVEKFNKLGVNETDVSIINKYKNNH